MTNYNNYLTFLKEQAEIAKPNALIIKTRKRTQEFLLFVQSNKVEIGNDKNLHNDLITKLNVNEKKESNILAHINRFKSVLKAQSSKGNLLKNSLMNLNSLVKERENSIFPKAAINKSHFEESRKIALRSKKVLTESDSLILIEDINKLFNNITNDLSIRDKKYIKYLMYAILSVVGIFLVVTYWGIFKWILLVVIILVILAMFQ